jgi:hypothetical protein
MILTRIVVFCRNNDHKIGFEENHHFLKKMRGKNPEIVIKTLAEDAGS